VKGRVVKRAIVPGTFDPVTSGHLDIIERAAGLFDDVIIGVAHSPEKGGGPLFDVDERVDLVRRAVSHLANVSVRPFDTLLVNFAKETDASVIVKGLRAVTDFEREFQMAALNWRLDSDVETMFIMAVPEYMYLSSSAVREIARHAGSVRGLVPGHVAEALEAKLKNAR
jgi:pantetheine-phosphate adenylyltransferase